MSIGSEPRGTSLLVIGCVLAVARDCVPGCEEAEIVRVTGIASINLQGETFPCSCAPVLKLILYLVDCEGQTYLPLGFGGSETNGELRLVIQQGYTVTVLSGDLLRG